MHINKTSTHSKEQRMKRYLVSILLVIFMIAAVSVSVFAQTPTPPPQQAQMTPADSAKQVQADSLKAAKAAADSTKKAEIAFWAKTDSIRKTFSKKGPDYIFEHCVDNNESMAAALLHYGVPKKYILRDFFSLNYDGQQQVMSAAFTSGIISSRCVELNGPRAKKWDAQITELARNDSALVAIANKLTVSNSDLTSLVQTTTSRIDSLTARVTSLEEAIKRAQFNDDAFKEALMRADLKKKANPKWEDVFKETGLTN